MRTRGTSAGSARKSPVVKKSAGSKGVSTPHKSDSQTPDGQEMQISASPVADYQTPASDVKSQAEFLTPESDVRFCGVADASESKNGKVSESVEGSYGNASVKGAERKIDMASSAAGDVAGLREGKTGEEEQEEEQGRQREAEVEGEEEVEEVDEIEEIEEIEDERVDGDEDELEEVEGRDGDEQELIEDGEKENGEEAEPENIEEEIEVIEEIEYEDEDAEEGLEIDEEEEEEEEMEEDEVEDEHGEGSEEESEQFADEYPDMQQVMPVSERQKRKKMEVFVGGLDRDATKEDLKNVFEKVGEVMEVRLMKSFRTGKNKGFAFVRYANAAQAQRAIAELDHAKVRGKMCGVVPNEENDIVFIGNLNKNWSKETILENLKKYGLENIEELTLMEDPQHAGMNRGFAFVEFSMHKDAKKGFKQLQRPDVFFGTDRPAKVAWADPVIQPDDEVMAQVKSVFVDGMPITWDEGRAKEHFGQYGEVERVVLARDMPFSKRKDFGFVNYAARESALACVEAMNHTELADGDSRIMVKVKLAKPHMRTMKTVGTGNQAGYRTDWHRGRRGVRDGRFFPGRGRGAEVGWGRGFKSGWARGPGRFGFGRGRGRFGRGFFRGLSRGASFSGRHYFRNETSPEQQELNALKEQSSQGDVKGKPDGDGKPLRQKFECAICGFGSDIESEFNTHHMSRVHKVLEKMRKEEKLNTNTPLSLLHEYASRHRCEVHYDIAAENSSGPFEVFATIGGGSTGIPCTRGVGKGPDKAKARQMAAADALEKIMDRVPDLEFGRPAQVPAQVRQQLYERPVAENPRSSRARDPFKRPFASDYRTSPPPRGNSAYTGGSRRRSGYLSNQNGAPVGHPRIRDPSLAGEYEGRAARSYSRSSIRNRYDDGGEYVETFGRGRGGSSSRGRNVLTAHREAYFQRLEQSQERGYGSNRLSAAIREYGEALPGAKRAMSALEDDPRMDNIPHRGHPRARVDNLDLVSMAPGGSEYARSLYPTSTSHQSALDTAGMYTSSSRSHDPIYGANDIHGSAELGSRYPSLYGYSQGPSMGSSYSMGGPGSGSYY